METDRWRSKRLLMMINFCFAGFSIGVTLTSYNLTEFFYLKDMVQVNNPDFLFGVSKMLLCGSGILSTFVVGVYVDKTKNVRRTFIVINLVCFLGNVLYTAYFSIAFVLIGQTMAGVGFGRTVAAYSEIQRVFTRYDHVKQVTTIAMFTIFGTIIGPCNVFLFRNVEVHLDSVIRLTSLNMIAVFMACLYLMELILVLLTLDNVSLIHNVKKETEKLDLLELMEVDHSEDDDIDNSKSIIEDPPFLLNYMRTLNRLRKDKYMMFIYLLCLVTSYVQSTIRILEPIKGNEYYSWDQEDVAVFTLVIVFVGVVPCLTLMLIIGKRIENYYAAIVALVLMICSVLCLQFLPYASNARTFGQVLLYAAGIFRTVNIFIWNVVIRSVIATAVPENIQTMADAIRNNLMELGQVLAGLLIYLPISYTTITFSSISVFVCVTLAWYLAERKHFENLKMK